MEGPVEIEVHAEVRPDGPLNFLVSNIRNPGYREALDRLHTSLRLGQPVAYKTVTLTWSWVSTDPAPQTFPIEVGNLGQMMWMLESRDIRIVNFDWNKRTHSYTSGANRLIRPQHNQPVPLPFISKTYVECPLGEATRVRIASYKELPRWSEAHFVIGDERWRVDADQLVPAKQDGADASQADHLDGIAG